MKIFFSSIVLLFISYNIGICQNENDFDVFNLVIKENSSNKNDNENYIYSYTFAIEHTGVYSKKFIENVAFRFRIFHDNEVVYSKVKTLNVNLLPGDIDWFTVTIGKRFPFFVACDNCTQIQIDFMYTY
jgi:elongation factor P hydroxylase